MVVIYHENGITESGLLVSLTYPNFFACSGYANTVMKYVLSIFIPFFVFLLGFGLSSLFVHEKSFKTPSLLGHSVIYALRQATDQGFTIKIYAEKETSEIEQGTILAQKPVPGALIKPKQAVFITIAKSPYQANVPHFIGRQESSLEPQGIAVKTFSLPHQTPSGMVIAQSPEAGVLYDNQAVKLFVSSGPQTLRIMPDLIGHNNAVVQEFLEHYGICVTLFNEPYDPKKQHRYPPGTIIAQKPLAGSWIDISKPLIVQLVVI